MKTNNITVVKQPDESFQFEEEQLTSNNDFLLDPNPYAEKRQERTAVIKTSTDYVKNETSQ